MIGISTTAERVLVIVTLNAAARALMIVAYKFMILQIGYNTFQLASISVEYPT